MVKRQPVLCSIRNEAVLVTCLAPSGRGPATVRPISCDHVSRCQKNVFCRFVNPLTTRLPFDPAVAAVAEPVPCLNLAPAINEADHRAS